ncbi:methyltransferase [Loktanella agnita]|uniref:methyltransferase n=1 Tax=Loktanella agnita TaxID=287097 RepID=UPI00398A4756
MVAEPSPTPLMQLLMSHMTGKYVFVASEMGLFAAIGLGAANLNRLAQDMQVPVRTLRIIADALVSAGFLEKDQNTYRNTDVTSAFLSGQSGPDFRPVMRLWDKYIYPQWATLEPALRDGKQTLGWEQFTQEQHDVFNEGVAVFTASSAQALPHIYDFSQHRRVLDLGGGMGLFLMAAAASHPDLTGTLFEMPQAAALARPRIIKAGLQDRLDVVEGDLLMDTLPSDYDGIIVANVLHLFSESTNLSILHRLRDGAAKGTRLLLIDFWTDPSQTNPPLAALMAGTFHMQTGEGDVYSSDTVARWLEDTGWAMQSHAPLAGAASLIVAQTL